MLKNQFNPLLAKAETQPRPGATGSPPNKPAAGGSGEETGGEGENEEQEEEDEDPADPDPEDPADPDPAAAAEAARPAPLSAFERGSLRALGMGKLVARLEKAEGDLAVANATIGTLTRENSKLKADAAAVPSKIEAAKKGRREEVAQAVTNELTSLGIKPEDAPSQTAADQTPDALLEKFNGLQGAEKTAFYRANKPALKAAQAAIDSKKSK